MPADRVLYLEPFSGASGDMMVGALLDLGFELERLARELRVLSVDGYQISAAKCLRAGIHATKFDVMLQDRADSESHEGHRHHRHGGRTYRDIRAMIETSGLSDWVKQKSLEAFLRLALAEGKIHNQPPEEVHFHEVGAVDSIVDIVGCMIALEHFLPARVLSAPVNVGQGTLECRHGIYPVPGPATQELLRGMPTYSNAVTGELTTPTGAALIATLVEQFAPRPLMRVDGTGYGAGSREVPGSANVLRITAGQEVVTHPKPPEEPVEVIEATIDDMTPQVYGYFQERALAEGALDVYAVPVQMKKNRPGQLVTVLCASDQLERLIQLFFSETTTIGIRHILASRRTLERNTVEVRTSYGTVRVKVCSLGGRQMNFAPEYEDCRRLASEKGVPLKEVIAAANGAYIQTSGGRR